MVKHTHTIRRQTAEELFECVWPFFGIGALRVKQICIAVFHEYTAQKSWWLTGIFLLAL